VRWFAAVDAEMVAGFPSGRLFLDSIEQAMAVALVNGHAVKNRPVQISRGGLGSARLRRNKAAKAGLYVVLVDSGVEKGAYVTTIGTNNKVAASAGAESAASLIDGKGNIAMLEGEPGGQTAADRTSGFHEGICQISWNQAGGFHQWSLDRTRRPRGH